MRSVISENRINTGFEKFLEDTRGYKKVIKILFVCHGSILKRVRKPGKIKGLREVEDLYYTTTTPFEKELNQLKEEYQ